MMGSSRFLRPLQIDLRKDHAPDPCMHERAGVPSQPPKTSSHVTMERCITSKPRDAKRFYAVTHLPCPAPRLTSPRISPPGNIVVCMFA